MERIFLGSDTPLLTQAVCWLVGDASGDRRWAASSSSTPAFSGGLDLRPYTIITPSSRGGRRLEELLTEAAHAAGKVLLPPTVLTISQAVDHQLRLRGSLAATHERVLAWVEACRIHGEELQRLLLPELPQELTEWYRFAQFLEELHTDLSWEQFDFAKVHGSLVARGSHIAEERWEVLAAVEREYLAILREWHLADPGIERLRLVELVKPSDTPLVFIGCPELPGLARAVFERCSDRRVALIGAESGDADLFDEFGTVLPDRWNQLSLSVPPEALLVADDISAEAVRTREALRHFPGAALSEITVGLTDETLLPFLQDAFGRCDLALHTFQGKRLPRTPLGALLLVFQRAVTDSSFEGLAEFVRHPWILAWLQSRTDGLSQDRFLTELDAWHQKRLPAVADGFLEADPASEKGILSATAPLLAQLLDAWRGGSATLSSWVEALRAFFRETVPYTEKEHYRELDMLLLQMAETRPFREVITSGPQALSCIARAVSGAELAPDMRDGALEVVGWLDLLLDDAPYLVVCGMNEGLVPESYSGHPLLPHGLRRELGIPGNSERFARDMHIMRSLLAARKRVVFVAAKKSAQGDPLLPSRLLLHGPGRETAERLLTFFSASFDGNESRRRGGSAHIHWRVPVPVPPDRVWTSLRVSDFRAYRRCPYRFYLERVCSARRVYDGATELTPQQFGDCAHDVLKGFSASPVAGSENENEIRAFLLAEVDKCLAQSFGTMSLASVVLQYEQLKERLRRFAIWQADWMKQGWRTIAAEFSPREVLFTLPTSRGEIGVKGRIDRVDRNLHTGELAVFDYKTGERAGNPNQTHRKGDEWIDFQLPAYFWGLREANYAEPIRLGLIPLHGEEGGVDAAFAQWSPAEIGEARDEMARIADAIVRGVFWPPREIPGDDDPLRCLYGDLTPAILERLLREFASGPGQSGPILETVDTIVEEVL